VGKVMLNACFGRVINKLNSDIEVEMLHLEQGTISDFHSDLSDKDWSLDALRIVKNRGTPLDPAILFSAPYPLSNNQRQVENKRRVVVAEDNMINQEVVIGLLEGDYFIDAVAEG
jgi:hypothetical protein